MRIITAIACDECNKVQSHVADTIIPKWMLIQTARERGWSIGKRCVCRDCKEKKKRSK